VFLDRSNFLLFFFPSIFITGDESALTAKGKEIATKGSKIQTTLVEAVAIEAGVDKTTITMTSTSMTKTTPAVSDELADGTADDTKSMATETDSNMIIIASAAGGGTAVLLIVIGILLYCRTKKKRLAAVTANNISVVPSKPVPQSMDEMDAVVLTDQVKGDIREWETGATM